MLKLLNFLISLFILGSNIIGIQRGEYSIIALSIGFFCLAISTYQNIWIFYISERLIFNRKGVLIFSKRMEYSFAEVSSIKIEKYQRAGKNAEYTEIAIQFKDGECFTIENDKTKRIKDEIEQAQMLQEILALHAQKDCTSS